MEKEFEALKFIFDEALFSEYKNETHNKVRECHSIVYEALKELKAIKEAKPSEALRCLEEMAQYRIEYSEYLMPIKDTYEFKTIKQALLKAQEQEKVLEIIKKKRVDIKLVLWAGDMVEAYNQRVREQKDYWWREELTQEEFDTLKRWCEKCLI